jgi:membrane-bound lytic murein transglycosylase D
MRSFFLEGCMRLVSRTTTIFLKRSIHNDVPLKPRWPTLCLEKNLPEEFFYLALIESGYNPKAFSRARASGIWQFLTKTGKRYGLKVDKWVDERRDPEKSTYAAAEHLKDLHEMFNNWDLVAASYNAGAGKVLRAMQKAKSQDFWEISRHRYLLRDRCSGSIGRWRFLLTAQERPRFT